MSTRLITVLSNLLFLFLLFLAAGCRKDPVVPPIESPKDPRTYTWTIDTLFVPDEFETALDDIWGANAHDVYAVGHNSGFRETIFHYDGSKWNLMQPLPSPNYPPGRSFEINRVFGFGSNDVWIGGGEIFYNSTPAPNYLDSTILFRYDGVLWQKQNLPLREGSVRQIWGDRPDNLWIAGSRAIWHFDGLTWTRDSIPDFVPKSKLAQISRLSEDMNRNLIAIVGSFDPLVPGMDTFLLLRNSLGWSLLDKSSAGTTYNDNDARFGSVGLWRSPDGKMYSFGMAIFEQTATSWTRIFQSAYPIRSMCGVIDKSIFAAGLYGTVLHYDGNTWYPYDRLFNYNLVTSGAWTDGNEIFISAYFASANKSVVMHGK